MHRNFGPIAGQRINGQCRAERRTADTDVDQAFDFAKCAFVDRIDQHLHAGVKCCGFFDTGVFADAALGSVLCGAAFGIVNFFALDQRVATTLKVHDRGNFRKLCFNFSRQVRF